MLVRARRDPGFVTQLSLDDLFTPAVVVERSTRARRWRLEAAWGEPARLVVPRRTSDAEIERILEEKRQWLERQVARQVPRLGLEASGVSQAEGRRRARALVTEAAAREALPLEVAYERIRIGNQRSLWGSCSPRGTLSFNWRLALAPLGVLEYVVVHELCHLRVPDHSRRFWRLVERARPGFGDERAWLREFGPELLAYRG